MRLLDKYILTSSVFAIFTEAFKFHYLIDWKLFYVIIISNFFLLSLRNKITLHKNMVIFLLFVLIHGVVSFFLLQNPIKSLIAQFLGISISSMYFYNFIKIYGSQKVYEKYLQIALLIAVLAIPMYYFNIGTFISNRLNGILTEPAHYAAIMLPAVYFFLRKKEFLKLSIVLFTVILSKSSIGYIGLLLILLIPLLKIKYFVKYIIAVVIIIISSVFYLKEQWNKPVDENKSNVVVRRLKETKESLKAISTGVFKEHTNLSTYALLSNTFITKNIILDKPLGTGLGAYPLEYEKYYGLMKPPPYLIKLKQSKINKTDANSLFLRGLSDFGVFWVLIMIYFIYKSVYLFKNEDVIRQSTFFYLVVKLLREGHYFPPEFYFFLILFLKDFDKNITHS